MRIKRAEIYAFGKWTDVTFHFHDTGVNYFYGENEAGKSTLQQFFLYMLFGLPPRKLKEFKPKTSSQIGGKLTLQFADEEVTIERVGQDVRCFLASGDRVEGEDYVTELLGGLTRELYTAIYAFSSLDLMELHQLKQDELSDLLFSVGLVGSSAIFQIEKELTKRSGELFKRNASKPEINVQLKRIETAYTDMTTAQEKEAEYRELTTERKQLEDALRKQQAAITETNDTLIYTQKVLQYLDSFTAYQQKQKEIAQYPATIPFPEDGVARYQALKDQLIPLKSEERIVATKQAEYVAQLERLRKEQLATEIYEAAKQLQAERNQENLRQEKIANWENELQQLTALINDRLYQVNVPVEEVAATTFPFQIETDWKKLIDEERALAHQREQLKEATETLEREWQSKQKEISQVKAQMLDEAEVKQLKTELAAYEQNSKQQAEQASLKAIKQTVQKQTKTYVSLLSFAALFLAGVGVYLERFELFFVVLLLLVLVGFQVRSVKQLKQTEELPDLVADLSSQRYEQLVTELEQQEKLSLELQMLEKECNQLALQKEHWQEKARKLAMEEHKLQEAIETEMQHYPFLAQSKLEYWLDLLVQIKEIQALIAEKQQLMHEIEQAKMQSKIYRKQCEKLLEQVASDRFALENVSLFEQIDQLVQTYEEQEQQIIHYENLVTEYADQLVALTEKMRSLEAEMTELFAIAQVADEEAYLQLANEKAAKERLQAELRELSHQLTRAFEQSEIEHLLEKQLNETDLEQKLYLLEAKRNELEASRNELQKKLATVSAAIEALESSHDYSEAVHTYELEKAKLNTLAQEWAQYTLAQTALTQAKRMWQEKYFHEVMQYTTTYFQQLTGGKYMKVFAPTEKEPFQVEAINEMRYTVNELSKGTVDQLYIALRLAISQVMRHQYDVPLILDDAMIHFDRTRMQRALELIATIAEQQQVLLFTFRDDIVKTIGEEQLHAL